MSFHKDGLNRKRELITADYINAYTKFSYICKNKYAE